MSMSPNEIPDIIHESWHKYLQPLFDSPEMEVIRKHVSKSGYYPQMFDVFKVFSMPMDKIKVVILGQDPYPAGQAIGLAFAVAKNTNMPASLKVIGNEVLNTRIINKKFLESQAIGSAEWRTLRHWHEQGVFLLNTALTVKPGVPGSHTTLWLPFTREIIGLISYMQSPIWMLWGSKAQAFEQYIDARIYSKTGDWKDIPPVELKGYNAILKAAHPAAETYNGGNGKKFTGCNHFNLCNEILQLKGQAIINW